MQTLKGVYQTEHHAYAVMHRTNDPMIVLDPEYRSYYGWTWEMIDCTHEVQKQWRDLHLQPGERVQITLNDGITNKIQRERA